MKTTSKILTALAGLFLSASILSAQLGSSPSPGDVESAVNDRLPSGVSMETAQPNQLATALAAVWNCENVVEVVDAATAVNPRSAVAVTIAATKDCPALAAQIAGAAAGNAPEHAVGIARAAASHSPNLVEAIAAAIAAAAPGANASDILASAQQGAASALAGAGIALPELDDHIFDTDLNNPSPSSSIGSP
ncbi:MAG: hypothetical protein JJU00_01450 [Opitutales bacterium]|nr:hypothetical protein [Opitutales bacterium]